MFSAFVLKLEVFVCLLFVGLFACEHVCCMSEGSWDLHSNFKYIGGDECTKYFLSIYGIVIYIICLRAITHFRLDTGDCDLLLV